MSPGLAASRSEPCTQDRLGRDLRSAAGDSGTDELASLKEAAKNGVGEAQRLLGEMYFLGNVVQRDFGRAAALLGQAVSRNVPGANDMLQRVDAFRFKRKKLMLKHLELAAGLRAPGDLEFLHLAAEEDMSEAQQLLGEMHLSGKGVPRDWREAAKWLSRAVIHRVPGTEGLLRQHLRRALQCNSPEDLDFLQGAAAEGVEEARYLLEYLKCKKGPQVDYRQAAEWLGCAAKCKGSRIGELLRQELRHAAELSNPHDVEFIRGAAVEEVGEAQKLLGEMHLIGKGVPLDWREAAKWLSRASKRKGSGAVSLLQQHLRRAAQRNGRAELAFLQGAADEDVAEAQKLLGEKYLYGRGVRRDRQQAIRLLRDAASRNEPGAKDLLQKAKFRIDPPVGRRPTPRPSAKALAYRNDWTRGNWNSW